MTRESTGRGCQIAVCADMLDRTLRTILDTIPDGVLVEAGDRIAYLNTAYARLLGYRSTAELAGATIKMIALEEEQDRLMFFGRCRAEGKPAPTRYQFRARRRDDSIATLDASISANQIGGQMLITTIVREIVPQSVAESLPVSGLKRLSPREREVVSLLLKGRRPKEIALDLGISEKTVGTFRARVFAKLALRNDLDLYRFGSTHGLIGS